MLTPNLETPGILHMGHRLRNPNSETYNKYPAWRMAFPGRVFLMESSLQHWVWGAIFSLITVYLLWKYSGFSSSENKFISLILTRFHLQRLYIQIRSQVPRLGLEYIFAGDTIQSIASWLSIYVITNKTLLCLIGTWIKKIQF